MQLGPQWYNDILVGLGLESFCAGLVFFLIFRTDSTCRDLPRFVDLEIQGFKE